MNTLRHPVAAMVIFVIMVSLSVSIYTGFEDTYGIQKGDIRTLTDPNYGNLTTGNIMDQFNSMPLIQGVQNFTAGVTKLSPTSATSFDVLGGILSVAIGSLKIAVGLLIFPFSMVFIVLKFYAGTLPAIAGLGLAIIFSVYVVFNLLSAFLRTRV